MLSGFAIGLLFMMVNLYYAFSFYVGSFFITQKKYNSNDDS
jgi:hypothetical protein